MAEGNPHRLSKWAKRKRAKLIAANVPAAVANIASELGGQSRRVGHQRTEIEPMAKTTILNPRWSRWQKVRKLELFGSGYDDATAERRATAEAKGRQRAARIVGLAAAGAAKLIVLVDEQGRDRAFLRGELDQLPAAVRQRYTKFGAEAATSGKGAGS